MDVPGADVTGGMWGKLEAAAAIARECECRIIGAGGFAAALTGDPAGTLVLP
jgi:isopentenyl phosphate kinase